MITIENIKWLGHAGFQIKSSKIIYIDPWKLKTTTPAADIILVTHAHYDHCSAQDINKIQKKDSIIIAPEDCKDKLSGNIKPIKPGERLTIEDITVEATAAYNIGKAFHPKSSNWVGFIITLDNTRIYHSGDTDLIPEMDAIKADIALLAIGGTYTMNVQEAASCAHKIKPKVVIPMHYGSIVGNPLDAQELKKCCDIEVQILKYEKLSFS